MSKEKDSVSDVDAQLAKRTRHEEGSDGSSLLSSSSSSSSSSAYP